MDFRQRILAAVNHEEADRVPVMGLIMDPATVNQVLGKEAVDLVALLSNTEARDGIREWLDANWEQVYYGNSADALESAIKLGFDANWTIYACMQLAEDAESPLGLVFHDAFGRVWEMGTAADGSLALNYSRPLCPTEQEWETWVERKAPLLDRIIDSAAAFYRGLAEEYGDRIYPIGNAAPGIFENSWQPIGFVEFTRFVYQRPDFVRRVIDFHTDLYIRLLESVMQSGVEVVMGGDDLGQKTGPIMRPQMIESLLGDSYRRVAECVHRQNRKLIWHSCGNIYALLEHFIDWGFDGIITMEPTAGMELERVRQMVGHRLVLVGNLDVSYLLVRGTREEIEDAVRMAIRDAAPGGGYILSACHSHPSVDANRLGWMVEAAHKYGGYPLGG